MNRPIKFRGKLKNDKEWVCGSLIIYPDGEHNILTEIAKKSYRLKDWNVDPNTIGQFIGILDRNGKEIYEGDIITVRGDYPRVVLWDKVSWAIMPCECYNDKTFWVMNLQHPGNDWWEEFADEIEVVGNMYDNPEMITNKSK